jgi:hypothetical protein
VFKVADKRCDQCLMGPNKIVSDERKQDLLEDILTTQTHFVCHKATINGEDVCCRGFYDAYHKEVSKLRIFKRIGLIEFVPTEGLDPIS